MFQRFVSHMVGMISYRLATKPSADLGASIGCLVGTTTGVVHGRAVAETEHEGYIWRPVVFGGGGALSGAIAGLYWPYALTILVAVDLIRTGTRKRKH
jgi:hypothetical protein